MRSITMAGIFAAWSGHFGWHMHAGASTYTDFGDTGWCFGASDYYIGNTSTADECWTECSSFYGSSTRVAIDWWGDGGKPYSIYESVKGACYCQNGCECRADSGDGATLLVADSMATTVATLPEVCTNQPVVMPTDVGRCSGGTTYIVGLYDSALKCWDACVDSRGSNLLSAAWQSDNGGSCYCKDECGCLSLVGDGYTLISPYSFAAYEEELPRVCNVSGDDDEDGHSNDNNEHNPSEDNFWTIFLSVFGGFVFCGTCIGIIARHKCSEDRSQAERLASVEIPTQNTEPTNHHSTPSSRDINPSNGDAPTSAYNNSTSNRTLTTRELSILEAGLTFSDCQDESELRRRFREAQRILQARANAANIAELTSRAAGNFPRLTHYQQPAIPTAHAYMPNNGDAPTSSFNNSTSDRTLTTRELSILEAGLTFSDCQDESELRRRFREAQRILEARENAVNVAELTGQAQPNVARPTNYQQQAIPTAHAVVVSSSSNDDMVAEAIVVPIGASLASDNAVIFEGVVIGENQQEANYSPLQWSGPSE